MRYFVYYAPSGEIVSEMSGPDLIEAGPSALGEPLEVDAGVSAKTHKISGGQVTPYSPDGAARLANKPGGRHTWNVATEQWEDLRALADVKADKNSAINRARARANSSTFPFQGKQIAVDQLSRSDIDATHGAILMLQALPPGWPGAWKAVDNTFIAIPDVATWGQFYGAMVATGTANFNHSQALKAQLAAASTVGEAEAVADW
jgi:hypothetical protein